MLRNQRGQSLIEVIIALGLLAIIFTGSWQVIHSSYMSINQEFVGLEAHYLVIEGMEGIRSMRDEDWHVLDEDGTYHFEYNETDLENKYLELITGEENVNGFRRRIEVSSVGRNSETGKITDTDDPLYILDSDTKLVDVIVEWEYLGETRTDRESVYFTKYTEMLYG